MEGAGLMPVRTRVFGGGSRSLGDLSFLSVKAKTGCPRPTIPRRGIHSYCMCLWELTMQLSTNLNKPQGFFSGRCFLNYLLQLLRYRGLAGLWQGLSKCTEISCEISTYYISAWQIFTILGISLINVRNECIGVQHGGVYRIVMWPFWNGESGT